MRSGKRTSVGYGRGFTLIELLVVVAIIALLITILLPSLANARRVSVRTQCGANMKSVGSAMGMYASQFDETLPLSYRGAFGYGYGMTGGQTGGNEFFSMHFISRFDANWRGINFWLGEYTGSAASKMWVCPGTGGKSPATYFPSNAQTWPNTYSGNPYWARGTYLWFMGDEGNFQVHGGQATYKTGPGTSYNPNPPSTPLYQDPNNAGTAKNVVFVPKQRQRLPMVQMLASDRLSFDYGLNLYVGNHTAQSAGQQNDTGAVNAGSRFNVNSAYNYANELSVFSSYNALMADFSVQVVNPSESTQVDVVEGSTKRQRLYTAFPAQQ